MLVISRLIITTLLLLTISCGAPQSISKSLSAGWYSTPGKGNEREIYVAILNRSDKAITIDKLIVNGDEDDDIAKKGNFYPLTLSSGQLILIPFTKGCHLPVSLKAKIKGNLENIKGLPAMPSAIPTGYEKCFGEREQ